MYAMIHRVECVPTVHTYPNTAACFALLLSSMNAISFSCRNESIYFIKYFLFPTNLLCILISYRAIAYGYEIEVKKACVHVGFYPYVCGCEGTSIPCITWMRFFPNLLK